jgi:hypothetical protein
MKLHKAILERYHAGHYKYETRIDGSLIDDMIEHEDDQADRIHTVSRLTFQGPEGDMTGDLRFTRLVCREADDRTLIHNLAANCRGTE